MDNNPDDNKPDITNGCTTCFLYYLYNQLGFSIEAIIAAASSTLGAVYRNLTGKDDGWQSFISLVNTFYPPGITYNPTGDAIFPVAHLASLDNAKILSSASWNERILGLDSIALAEIVVGLSSDNPAILFVPPQVTLQPGTWATGINLSAAAITGSLQMVSIHATYAGKTLSSTVQILPRPSVLEGQVMDSSLNPIADATVFLSASGPITPVSGNTLQLSTDRNGFYQTPAITPQFYQVTAGQSGYVPAQATVTVGEGIPFMIQNFVLIISLPFTIKGTVLSQNSSVLVGATVTLDINSAVPGRLQTITDANGDYTITDNPKGYNGNYTLTATIADFMSSSMTFTIPNGSIVIKNLVLAPLGSLSGTVWNTMVVPIADATVTAGMISVRSDATGAYSLAGLDPGLIEVTVSAPDYDPTQTQVMMAAGAHIVQDITLTPASAILTGMVFSEDDGSPIRKARVLLVGLASTQTDDMGSYTLSNVPAGDQEVQASANRFKPQTAVIHVIAHQTLQQGFALQSLHPSPPHGPSGEPF